MPKTQPLFDLNSVGPAFLSENVPGVSRTCAESIVAFRSQQPNGRIRKLGDLGAVPGVGLKTLKKLEPYIMPLLDMTANRVLRPGVLTAPSPSASPAALRVCTWNMQHLTLTKPDFALHVASAVIECMDLVAIQEVQDPAVLSKLLMLLPGWAGVVSPPSPPTATSSYTERYAFLYRVQKLRLVRARTLTEELQGRVVRPPLVCTFRSVHDGSPLVCINFHAVYGRKLKDRRSEVVSLQEAVLQVAAASPEVTLCLLGDFNLSCLDGVWTTLRVHGWLCSMMPDGAPTTLSNYFLDGVWWLRPRDFSRASVYRYVKEVDMDVARAVSDHWPVHASVIPVFVVSYPGVHPDLEPGCEVVVAAERWEVGGVGAGGPRVAFRDTSTRVMLQDGTLPCGGS